MWSDNETARDYVNFSGVSKTIAEIVLSARGDPVSIGVSGSWGVGKSSMLRLTRAEIEARLDEPDARKVLFVDFNAWLYQGYDDARAALIDVILEKLKEEAKNQEGMVDRVNTLFQRVNWLRTARAAAPMAISLLTGVPVGGAAGGAWDFLKKMCEDGKVDDPEKLIGLAESAVSSSASFFDPAHEKSPPQKIQELRDEFEHVLKDLKVTLLVMVDDLDRCLPPTAIATLEAMRLFLFLKHTAFVIAADERVIRHAVKDHFKGIADDVAGTDLVTSYFDKLIQIPLRVPPLGTQEVRAYMIMLFVEDSNVQDQDKEMIRKAVLVQLSKSWKGERVDRDFLKSLYSFDDQTLARIDTAQRLAPMMTSMDGIQGNPRLIKRFLNALSLRKSMALNQGVIVDEAVLAKLLLFERLGSAELYKGLITEVTGHPDGHPISLAPLEDIARQGTIDELPKEWQIDSHPAWLQLDPPLAQQDLRGALYIGREHSPILLSADELDPKALDLLAAILDHPATAAEFEDDLQSLSKSDRSIIMDRVLEKAASETAWGTPDVLDAMICLSAIEKELADRVASFLRGRSASSVQASIVPRIGKLSWADGVLLHWSESEVSQPVKKAIQRSRSH